MYKLQNRITFWIKIYIIQFLKDRMSSIGGLTWNDLYDTICMTLIERVNCKIVTTLFTKICMIRYLKDRMSSIPSNLYEGILKPIKSHANRIIQIFPRKSAFCLQVFMKRF